MYSTPEKKHFILNYIIITYYCTGHKNHYNIEFSKTETLLVWEIKYYRREGQRNNPDDQQITGGKEEQGQDFQASLYACEG